jgi:hypothetical protein
MSSDPVVPVRGLATAWSGFDAVVAGGTVRRLTTRRLRITIQGIAVVERHLSRFGPDHANRVMIARLHRIACGDLHPTTQDVNFYAHELRKFVRYRRGGWADGVPADSEAAMHLWRHTHSATLADYGLPLRCDAFLYHPEALSLLGE